MSMQVVRRLCWALVLLALVALPAVLRWREEARERAAAGAAPEA